MRNHFDYVCYNAVKHGLVACPHAWSHSSFARLVTAGQYPAEWRCRCAGPGGTGLPFLPEPAAFAAIARAAGE